MKTKKGHSFSAKLMSVAAIAFMFFVASCEKDDPTPEPLATCDDGIQNGDETGIDCGGSCKSCEEPITMAAPNINDGTIDMEEEGMGPDLSEENEENGVWGVFAADGDSEKVSLEIVDNPNNTGNASAKVLKLLSLLIKLFGKVFSLILNLKCLFQNPTLQLALTYILFVKVKMFQ